MQADTTVAVAVALGFATAAHFGQKRKFTYEDYIVHPVRVAGILTAHGYTDPIVLTSALLHDVVEDTEVTLPYIQSYFGPDVAENVDWLTKRDWTRHDGNPLKRWERKELEASRLKGAPALVKTIKLADRLDNMTMLHEEPKFAAVFAAETRHLLDYALSEGDAVIWAKIDKILKDFAAVKLDEAA